MAARVALEVFQKSSNEPPDLKKKIINTCACVCIIFHYQFNSPLKIFLYTIITHQPSSKSNNTDQPIPKSNNTNHKSLSLSLSWITPHLSSLSNYLNISKSIKKKKKSDCLCVSWVSISLFQIYIIYVCVSV